MPESGRAEILRRMVDEMGTDTTLEDALARVTKREHGDGGRRQKPAQAALAMNDEDIPF